MDFCNCSQGRIILRLTESLEFLLIIRGDIAKARHISTSYKNLVEPSFDLFASKPNTLVSCYASAVFSITCMMGNNFSMLFSYLV